MGKIRVYWYPTTPLAEPDRTIDAFHMKTRGQIYCNLAPTAGMDHLACTFVFFFHFSACKFFKDFKLHTPYDLVTFVV